jgi:hypothetical protein
MEGARDVSLSRVVGLLFGGLVVAARAVGGQAPSTPGYAEFRVDAIIARATAIQGGVGGVIPLGTYVRVGIDAAGGATVRDGSSRASGRIDAIGRFLLDPFREAPVGVSLGGGLSLQYVDGDKRVRPYLTAVVDIEGKRRGAITPALQLGLGGGTRVGVVLRPSQPRWR